MRRKDREVTGIEEIEKIMCKCDVCRLAFFDSEYPYIVPMNFGFSRRGETLELYFHGANEGKKLSLLQQNNKVCFEMDCSHKLIEAEKACGYTMEYESVIGFGTVKILGDDEKIQALAQLMKQYTAKNKNDFDEKYLKVITVFKLTVTEVTGKRLSRE